MPQASSLGQESWFHSLTRPSGTARETEVPLASLQAIACCCISISVQPSDLRREFAAGPSPSQPMAAQGAALQTHNNELVKVSSPWDLDRVDACKHGLLIASSSVVLLPPMQTVQVLASP